MQAASPAYSFIDFFRALAAFWVLAAHCMIWGGWYGIPLPSAKIAVDLFMMISGFLMSANASARAAQEPLSVRRNWVRFWLRRFFRLAPAYYLSLAIAVVLSDHFLGGYSALQGLNPGLWVGQTVYDPLTVRYSWDNVLVHLSFLFGLHPDYSFSTFLPDWSLSLEMQFYLLFPALLLSLQRGGYFKPALIFGTVVVFLGIRLAKVVAYDEPSLLLFKLQYFIAGMLVFEALNKVNSRRRRCGLVASAVFLVSLDYRYRGELVVLPLLLLSMFLVAWLESCRRLPGWLQTLISARITHFASNASYGVYLFHGFFISAAGLLIVEHQALRALTPQQRVMAIFLFVVVSAYSTAYASHRWVELPGIALGRRLIRRLVPAAVPRG